MDKPDLPVSECNNAHDQFRGITETHVEQSSDSLSDPLNSSVAQLSSEPNGMRAKKFVVNTIVGDHSKAPEISANGRKIKRMLIYALKRMVRMSLRGLEDTTSCKSERLPSRGLPADGALSLSISPPFWVLDIGQEGRQFDGDMRRGRGGVVVGGSVIKAEGGSDVVRMKFSD